MTVDQYLISAILLATLLLFAWGKYRHDIVAALAASACVLTQLVPAAQVFQGFAHPAVITVAAVLVISDALRRSGLVDWVASRLISLTENLLMHVLLLTSAVTLASAFMNNVGALALFLPIALATSARHQRSPAIVLMPLAFGSILGGMTTAIGTPPNIIIANLRDTYTGAPFGFFDYSAVGGVIAVAGVLFIGLIGWRLIPKERRNHNPPQGLFAIEEYISELRVSADSSAIGITLEEIEGLGEALEVVGISRFGRLRPANAQHRLAEGDVLILRGDIQAVPALAEPYQLTLSTAQGRPAGNDEKTPNTETPILAEGVVQQGSMIDGQRVRQLNQLTAGDLAILGLARQGRTLNRRLADQLFKPGDVILVQGERASIDQHFQRLAILPLAERNLALTPPRRILLALAIFVAAIGSGVMGWLPLPVAFSLAVLAYILLDFIPSESLYQPIDWSIIVLLALMLPVGIALESTGLTALAASTTVELTSGLPIMLMVAFVMIITMFLSDIINNAATAVVMAPIARDIAQQLNLNVDPFLMAVAVGASCAFLTPIGHQSNTLVMGPGGYAFGDYWRMGLPLEMIIVLLGVPLLLWVWPL